MRLATAKDYAAQRASPDFADGACATSPFQMSMGADHIVEHRAWRDALDRLRAAVLAGPGVTLLVGQAGTGKTLMLRALADELRTLGAGVVLQPRGDIPPDRLDPRMGDPLVVLVDEADRMHATALEKLGINGPYAVVLAGLTDRGMDDGSVEVVPLSRLDETDVSNFVSARLASAGLPGDLFGDEAIHRLSEHAAGVPRLVNSLAGAALFLAKRDGASRVGAGHVDEAAMFQRGEFELSGVSSPAPRPSAPSDAQPPASRALVAGMASIPPAPEPLGSEELTFVYPVAVVPPLDHAPNGSSSGWSDLLWSIRSPPESSGRPSHRRRPVVAIGSIAAVAVAAGAWLLIDGHGQVRPLASPTPVTSPTVVAEPQVAGPVVSPASAPAEVSVAPLFDDSSATRSPKTDDPAPAKLAETVPPTIEPAAPTRFVPVHPYERLLPEIPDAPPALPTIAEPPAPAPAPAPMPATVSAPPAAVSDPGHLTISLPLPVVIRYSSAASDGGSRAARLGASLRAAGYTATTVGALARTELTPGARFFFAEDRAQAVAVLRASGLPGSAVLATPDDATGFPRPGTVELVMK